MAFTGLLIKEIRHLEAIRVVRALMLFEEMNKFLPIEKKNMSQVPSDKVSSTPEIKFRLKANRPLQLEQ